MEQKLIFEYINQQLNVAIKDVKTVYCLAPLTKLIPEVYKGKLVYRFPGKAQRISYAQIKKGLVKKQITVTEYLPF
jgi:hypothetical protein